MEQEAATARYIIPYTLERHEAEFLKVNLIYRSIYRCDHELVGFLILVLDDDGISLEFRRIVIREKGKGFGKRAVALIDAIATNELSRPHIWLDVFDFNDRGRHIYSQHGYNFVSQTECNGKTLYLYEKRLWRCSPRK